MYTIDESENKIALSIPGHVFDGQVFSSEILGTENADSDLNGDQVQEWDDVIFGLGGFDYLFGHAGDDILYGGAGNDTANGGDGDDVLVGGDGDDHLTGGIGHDYLLGGEGEDLLIGQAGNDHLFGDAGNDTLFGYIGNDVLTGGAGNDTLTGGKGFDVLYGNEGADIFQLASTGLDANTDEIADFDISEDMVDLSQLLDGFNASSGNLRDFVAAKIVGTNTIIMLDPTGERRFLSEEEDVATFDVFSLTDVTLSLSDLLVNNAISLEGQTGTIKLIVDNSDKDDAEDEGVPNGSADNPFAIIQEAIDHAGGLRGDSGQHVVIQVKEGKSNDPSREYEDSVFDSEGFLADSKIDIANAYEGFTVNISNITVQSHPDNENSPRIASLSDGTAGAMSGQFGAINVVAQDNVTIDGLHVASSHNIGIYVSASDTLHVWPEASDPKSDITLINNKVEFTDGAGISVSGTRIFQDNPVVEEFYLENVEIIDNDVGFTNFNKAETEAISLGAGTRNFKINGNTVHDTHQYGIDVKIGAEDGEIIGNHVYNIERYGIYMDSGNRTIEDVEIAKNLIHNVSHGVVLARETGNPEVQEKTSAGTAENSDPLFVIEPNLKEIGVRDNIIFDTESFGILAYRHNLKDAFGGTFDLEIVGNTVLESGPKADNANAEAIRVAANLFDISDPSMTLNYDRNGDEIEDGHLQTRSGAPISEQLDVLTVNGISYRGAIEPNENSTREELLEDIAETNTFPAEVSNVSGSGQASNDGYLRRVLQTDDNTFAAGMVNDIVYAGLGDDDVAGNNGYDILFGGGGNDFLKGGAGNDFLVGDGPDSPNIDWSEEVLKDLLEDKKKEFADQTGDTPLPIPTYDDTLWGGDHDDILIGLHGDDTLSGGKGKDILIGNEGADTFVIYRDENITGGDTPDINGNIDIIADFDFHEGDTIDLSRVSTSDGLELNKIEIRDYGTHTEINYRPNSNYDFADKSTMIKLLNVSGLGDLQNLVDNDILII